MRAAQLRVPRRRVAVLAAVLGAAAAFAPPAVADIPPVPTASVLPDPAAIVAAALAAAQPAVTPMPEPALPAPASAPPVLTLVPPQPESVPPADPALAAPLEQVTTTAPVDAPAVTPVEASVEAPAAVPDPPPAPVAAPVQQTVEETVVQAVQQVQPVNVNISVRVDSPGDNGAVSQLNAAISTPLAVAEEPEARYQAPDPQYQERQSSNDTPVPPVAPPDAAPAPARPEDLASSWDWTWNWNCGDAMAPSIVLPAGLPGQIWNWNWNWNCGQSNNAIGNTDSQLSTQYQRVTSQYQPTNVNVSIRVASPGNDGPVIQANVAVAVPGLVAVAVRPALLPVVAPVTLFVQVESLAGPAAAPTEASELLAALLLGSGSPEEESASSEAASSGKAPIRSVLERDPSPDRSDPTAATSQTASVAPVSASAIAALAPPGPAVAAGRRARAQEQRGQAHVPRIAPNHAAAGILGFASVGPLGAGASDRQLLLVFLFLTPFLLVFADAARRISEESIAEAADSGRRREKPG